MVSSITAVKTSYSTQAARTMNGIGPVEAVRPIAPRGPRVEQTIRPGEQPAAFVQISSAARQLAQQGILGPSDRSEEPAFGFDESAPVSVAGAPSSGESRIDDTEEATPEVTRAEEDASDPTQLSEEEQQQVVELQKRDQEVRTHEQAHKSVGGQYAGAIHYDFQRGPDGQNYAIGGHVNIDVSKVPNDPSATIAKMQQVVRAALAPAQPSSADRSVAAKANGQASEARQELAEETSERLRGSEESSESAATSIDEPTQSGAEASFGSGFDGLLRGAYGEKQPTSTEFGRSAA